MKLRPDDIRFAAGLMMLGAVVSFIRLWRKG